MILSSSGVFVGPLVSKQDDGLIGATNRLISRQNGSLSLFPAPRAAAIVELQRLFVNFLCSSQE